MPFDRDIALYLVSDNDNASADDKIEMEIIEMTKDWTATDLSNPSRAEQLRTWTFSFALIIRKAIVDLDIDEEIVAFFERPGEPAVVQQQWLIKARQVAEDTAESYKEKQKRVEVNLLALMARLKQFAQGAVKAEVDPLLDLLDLLYAVRAPAFLVAPLAAVAFSCLHAMPEDERRLTIGMNKDRYEKDELLHELAIARSGWAVDKASGTLAVEVFDLGDAPNPFEWPRDDVDEPKQ